MFDRRRIATPLSHDAGDDAPPTDRNGGGVSILGPRDVPRVRRTLLHLYERGRAAAVYELGETARSGAFAGPGNFVPITLGVSLVTGFVVRTRRGGNPLLDIRQNLVSTPRPGIFLAGRQLRH